MMEGMPEDDKLVTNRRIHWRRSILVGIQMYEAICCIGGSLDWIDHCRPLGTCARCV